MKDTKKMGPKPQHDLKRQKILEAAGKVLAQCGYAQTTISLVAEKAGVSRGLLHYYFKSKEEMLAQVIRETTENSNAMLGDIFDRHSTPEGLAEGLTALLRDAAKNNPELFYLYVEGFAWAKHSTLIRREMADLYGQWIQIIEEGLTRAQARGTIRPRYPVKTLAVLITALQDGLWLQCVSAPEQDDEDFIFKSFGSCIAGLLDDRQ